MPRRQSMSREIRAKRSDLRKLVSRAASAGYILAAGVASERTRCPTDSDIMPASSLPSPPKVRSGLRAARRGSIHTVAGHVGQPHHGTVQNISSALEIVAAPSRTSST
jgi:hypothetical protein